MRRIELAEFVASRVGRGMHIEGLGTGWPVAAAVTHPDGYSEAVSIYLARVGRSQRGRDDVERRFQVKGGVAIVDDGFRAPLLLGVWDQDDLVDIARPVLVAPDTRIRVGRTTQVSIFVPLTKLEEAAELGWSTYVSSSGEVIKCFVPQLLPLFAAVRDGALELDVLAVQAAVAGTGLLDGSGDAVRTAAARARRVSSVLVRNALFASRVRAAYGDRCAMCGLGGGIVEAAHIIPISAANDDSPRNGLALCPNHHRLFDNHLVGVDPHSGEIIYAPSVREAAGRDGVMSNLVATTFSHLSDAGRRGSPKPGVFEYRYAHFANQYTWLGY